MSCEKNLKQQRKIFREMVKNLIYFETSSPFVEEQVTIRLPKIPNMNQDNIKPALNAALGYTPKILAFQETFVLDENSKKIPVVLVVFELK